MIANMFATKSGNWFTKKMLLYSFIERDLNFKLVKIVFDFGFIGGRGGGVATTPSKLVPLSLWFVIWGTHK